jgi:hypothetical protein
MRLVGTQVFCFKRQIVKSSTNFFMLYRFSGAIFFRRNRLKAAFYLKFGCFGLIINEIKVN